MHIHEKKNADDHNDISKKNDETTRGENLLYGIQYVEMRKFLWLFRYAVKSSRDTCDACKIANEFYYIGDAFMRALRALSIEVRIFKFQISNLAPSQRQSIRFRLG